MVLNVHTVAVPTGWLARANPVAKLAACFVLGFGAALSDDAVTPAVLLVLVVLALATGGIRIADVLRRGWLLLVSAVGLGATTLLFGDSPTPWLTALTATIRVLAVALPGVVVLLTIDPTDVGRFTRAERSRSGSIRLRLTGRAAATSPDGRGVADDQEGSAGPRCRRRSEPAPAGPALCGDRFHPVGRRYSARHPPRAGHGCSRIRRDRTAHCRPTAVRPEI